MMPGYLRNTYLLAVILGGMPWILFAQFERGDALVNFSGNFVSEREKEPEQITFNYQFSGRFYSFLDERWALGLEAATRFASLESNTNSIYLFDNYLSPAGRYYLLEDIPLYLQLNLLFQQQGIVRNTFFATSDVDGVWRLGLGLGIGSTLRLSGGTSLDLGFFYRYLNSEEEMAIRTGYSWQFSLNTVASFSKDRDKYWPPSKKRPPGQSNWLFQSQLVAFGPETEGQRLDGDVTLGFFLADDWAVGTNVLFNNANSFSDPSVAVRGSSGEGFIRYYRPLRNNLQWFPALSYTRGRERSFRDDELASEIRLRHFSFGAGASYFLNRYTALEFQLSYARGSRNIQLPFNSMEDLSFWQFSVNLMHYTGK